MLSAVNTGSKWLYTATTEEIDEDDDQITNAKLIEEDVLAELESQSEI